MLSFLQIISLLNNDSVWYIRYMKTEDSLSIFEPVA